MTDSGRPYIFRKIASVDFTTQWLRVAATAIWLCFGACALLITMQTLDELPRLHSLLAPLQAHVTSEKALYSPLTYFCLLSLVFILERYFPVRRQQFFSVGFAMDLLWYFGNIVLRVMFLGFYLLLLEYIYRQYLSFLTLDSISTWSTAWRFLLAVLVDDFLTWFSHLIRHKVPLFWKFHAVHHSQSEMNLFTDARVHPLDFMISSTMKFIPFMMLANEVPVILAWAIFDTVYPKFYHANIRTNLGPLRYILVTPQFHRVHHAFDIEYRDKNFGRTFSIWDRLFGTHYRDDFTYPDTGIADPAYPHEQGADLASLAATFAKQLIYPFRLLFRAR